VGRLAGEATHRLRDDANLDFLSKVFWFSVEFGVVVEDGELRAYGAGILSSYGEMGQFRDMELRPLVQFYAQGRNKGSFDAGVQRALERILASPLFVFRVEEDPDAVKPGVPYRIPDVELASRLSFFLWSSIPDEELLRIAQQGRLTGDVLDAQVARMLADPRASALVANFAGQWLHLRNVRNVQPNTDEFPDFDDNLRQAFRRETELLVDSIIREDRSVLDLLTADYTFVNERLARHYGIPDVYGSHFRRVPVTDDARRGLLGHGSMLAVTSHAERTSPVLRGKWVLENLLGRRYRRLLPTYRN